MKILVFTTVYPNQKQPNLGTFVRERMSKVGELCELQVLAPVPYFPFAGFLKKKYRHHVPFYENQNGISVYHPKFFSIPGLIKTLDGYFLYLSTIKTTREIQKKFNFDLIDAHFAYPCGFAAVLLGKHFKKPVTITLRGTINRLINLRGRRHAIRFALNNADRIFSVSLYLAKLAQTLGISKDKFTIIPNGVDLRKFRFLEKFECRERFNIPRNSKVIISVGGLVERKGHHRVLEILPELTKKFPDLLYIIVGGRTVEGDMTHQLKNQVESLGLKSNVMFTGEIPHYQVNQLLSAADIFVLATRYEGWANVFCEAMACGLPVVTTRVCGNPEIIDDGETGILVPFGDTEALRTSIIKALQKNWDRDMIMRKARIRTWEVVAREVYEQFEQIVT